MTAKKDFRFGSRASCYYVCIQAKEPKYLPGTATIIGYEKEILAEFGVAEGEYMVTDKNGEPMLDEGTGLPFGRTANIRGHYFDSRAQQEQKGWTDAEHDRVVARLQHLCVQEPQDVWALEDVRLAPPLPGWESLSAARRIAISAELGLVGDALAYERQQNTDPDLIAKLERKVAAQVSDAALEAELVA
jgi:hypothetical protein